MYYAWETLTCQDAEEGDFVTLGDGSQMHFVEGRPPTGVGDAGPIILIHGLLSSALEWKWTLRALAATHRVWAIDLIGFGYSARVIEPRYSFKYYAGTVREFLDALGLERATLVGHSLGGGIALQAALDFPDRVDKLVLLAPAVYPTGWLKTIRVALQVPYLPQAVTQFILHPRVHRLALRGALGMRGLDDQTLAARARCTNVRGSGAALLAMGRSALAASLPRGLGRVAQPTLILWGERDPLLPVHHGRRLVRELPNAKLAIVKGAGHVLHEEFPDQTNSLILGFLEPESGPGIAR